MRFVDLFGRHRVEPVWEYTTSGILWHVRVVTENLLLGEDRDPETRQATFFCIDLSSGRERWRRGDYGDRWWIGIAGVVDGTLLLHGFSTPDLPLHRGVVAIDVDDGRKKWENPDLVALGRHNNNLVGHLFTSSGDECLEVSLESGETIGVLDRRSAEEFPSVDSAVKFPAPLEESRGDAGDLLARIAPSLAGLDYEGPITAYVHSDRIAIAIHERKAERGDAEQHFRHLIQLIDAESGRSIVRHILDEDTVRLIPEPFFVYRDVLYCIRERRTLMAIPLGATRDPHPAL